MQRIVFFIRFYPPFKGGAESQTARLALALAESGTEVLVVTGQGAGCDPVHPRLHVRRLDCNSVQGLGTVIYVLKAVFHACCFLPDIVIPVLLSDTLLAAWLVSKMTGAKRFYRLSGAGITGEFSSVGKVQRRYKLYRYLLHSFHLICISDALKGEAMNAGFKPDQITCIPNGIPLHGESPTLLSDEKLLICIGRLSKEKGFDIAIEAFSRSGLGQGGWNLRIYGDGPERAALEHRSVRLKLQVQFLGAIENVPDVLALATIFILPSRSEGMSNAMLEAMAAARPIIATDVSGVRDVLEDGKSALIVPIADIEAMAKAMRRYANDIDLRQSCAQEALNSVQRNCSMDVVIGRWMKLFKEKRRD